MKNKSLIERELWNKKLEYWRKKAETSASAAMIEEHFPNTNDKLKYIKI